MYVYLLPQQTAKVGITIPPDERLAITQPCLATGESYESPMYKFQVHKTTI